MNVSSIKFKMASAMAGIGLLVLLQVGIGFFNLLGAEGTVADLQGDVLPSMESANAMNASLGQLRADGGSLIASSAADRRAAIEASIATAKANFSKNYDIYLGMIEPDHTAERAKFIAIGDKYKAYLADEEKLIKLADAGDKNGALALYAGEMMDLYGAMKPAITSMVTANRSEADGLFADFATTSSVTRIVTILIALVSIVIVLAACWFVLSRIASPISTLIGSMRSLADGDNDTAIPYADRTDEIGAIAGAVETFRRTALAKEASDQEVEATRSSSEADRAKRERSDRERAAAMAQATADLAAGLKSLSAGDLSVQIETRFAPEFEQLRADFNSAVQQLARTLATVAETASSIDASSKDVAGSAGVLAQRTEQQAAALEETAAALGQITSTVGASSRRVEEARAVAVKANQSAVESGAVVTHAVEAMSRIEGSSNQIANIISVIDEIAFQTNLLALNAGVEAARAGEAGRGFAVVAQEVRELAQRSANAAREIKTIISASASEVSTGVQLVSETGQALDTIGRLIAEINDHMSAIATAAREQSTGLAEVNTAVTQMDQTTQQNAAMVEESTAAASSLASESASLKQLIAQFQLGRSEAGRNPVHALQQRASRGLAAPGRARSAA
ncbi:methyl-accepting chemotaxis protein [Jiella sp. M17.18]|uniref:HAMP domain-containing methyl-accepting chemotaxis protein n=1 Tax=Jiella sp. M17.18 TaxID=3234247 RepID=UPI0034DFE53E